MTTPTEAVYTVLQNFAGLTALVSTRVYAILMPQDPTVPAVTFQRITAERVSTLAPAGGNGVERARIRVIAWGKTLAECQAVAEQVRQAMNAATTFKVEHLVEIDDFENDTLLYSVLTDYAVWYKY